MALGRNNNNEQGELIVLNLKTVDENRVPIEPRFDVLRKNPESGKFEKTGAETSFSGRLKSVQTKVSEYKKDGKVVESKEKVDLYVADGDETYLLSLNYNIASRGLFNRILNLESFENLEINCWRDKNNYNVLTLRQNGQSVKGKYTRDDVPAAKEVKLRGQVVRDYQEIDDFFKENLVEFGDNIKSFRPVAPKKEVEVSTGVLGQGDVLGDDGSDAIPF